MSVWCACGVWCVNECIWCVCACMCGVFVCMCGVCMHVYEAYDDGKDYESLTIPLYYSSLVKTSAAGGQLVGNHSTLWQTNIHCGSYHHGNHHHGNKSLL